MLHVDVPTFPELRALAAARDPACVSIYVSTTPLSQHVGGSRIALGNLVKKALAQLDESGIDKRRRAALAAELTALGDDDAFWRLQAQSLAVLATPDVIRTYRLATQVADTVEVADRFHIKPLLRAIAFPQHAYVLALSEGAVRIVEIFADAPPIAIRVPGMPKDAADAVGRASLNNLGQNTRISNSEGQKVLLRQYARVVDGLLRPVLAGRDTPLILAATDPLAPIYRAVNSYPAMLPEGLSMSPDQVSDAALAEAARPILDKHYARQVEAAVSLFGERANQMRASSDLATIARAATLGAVDILLVDMDHTVTGTVTDLDGVLTLAAEAGAGNYDILDEIAGRALLSGAKVLAVRQGDLPDGGKAAAVMRYPV